MKEPLTDEQKLQVSLFERRLWEEAGLLIIRGNFKLALESKRLYESRHGIAPVLERHEEELARLMAAAGLAALSLSERESWGWTLSTAGAPCGFFCGVEPEGMICARLREAPTDRSAVYLQRKKTRAPLVESHYEPEGNDPVNAVQRYFEKVEQIPTRVAVDAHLDCVLVQALPDGDFERVRSLDDAELLSLAARLEASSLLKKLDDVVLFYECRCNDELILEMITGLPHSQRAELWGDLEQMEVECPRCGRNYVVTRGDGI